MAKFTYTHWENYYKKIWIKKYTLIEEKIKTCNYKDLTQKKLLLREFVLFFNSTCWLLRYFLNNNGLFYNTHKTSIMGAFRYDFIEDGDTWMIVWDYLNNYKKYGIDFVINFCIKDHFNIYNELQAKFTEIMEH